VQRRHQAGIDPRCGEGNLTAPTRV
jgi:hypothetical protein